MSVFNKLSKSEKADVFSGAEVRADRLPMGKWDVRAPNVIVPFGAADGVFRLVRKTRPGASLFGAGAFWRFERAA